MKQLSWADVALGVWLIASPVALGYSTFRPVALAEDFLPGLFLIVTSAWILAVRKGPLRVGWFQGICGLWLVAGSVVLVFDRLSQAAVNVLIVGLLVLAVNLVESWTVMHELSATS